MRLAPGQGCLDPQDERRLLVTGNRGVELCYFPGGRRVPGETDAEALVREIAEELSVEILPDTMRHFGTYEIAGADDTVRRMTCYLAEHHGTLIPDNEIVELAWIGYRDRDRTSDLDRLVIDDLRAAGHLR